MRRAVLFQLMLLLSISFLASGCWYKMNQERRDFLGIMPVKAKSPDKVASPLAFKYTFVSELDQQKALADQSPTVAARDHLDRLLVKGFTSYDDLVVRWGEPEDSRITSATLTAVWSCKSEWDKGYWTIYTSRRTGKGKMEYKVEVTFRRSPDLFLGVAKLAPPQTETLTQSQSTVQIALVQGPGSGLADVASPPGGTFTANKSALNPAPLPTPRFLVESFNFHFEQDIERDHNFDPLHIGRGAGSSLSSVAKKAAF